MLLAKLHFKLPTGAHLLLMEYQLCQLCFQQSVLVVLSFVLAMGFDLFCLLVNTKKWSHGEDFVRTWPAVNQDDKNDAWLLCCLLHDPLQTGFHNCFCSCKKLLHNVLILFVSTVSTTRSSHTT